MTKRILYRNIVALFIILVTFSIIDGYIKIPVSILMIVMIATSFLYSNKSFANKQTFALLFYFVILIVNVINGSEFIDLPWLAQEFLIPFASLSIINVFLHTKDFRALKTVTYTGILILIILSIPTIILLQLDSDLLRNSISATENNPGLADAMSASGIVRYGVIEAVPFLIPFLVFYIKTENKLSYKLLLVLFLALEYFILVRASFATSLILASAAIVLALIGSGRSNKKSVLAIVAIIVFFSLNKQLLVFSLNSVKPFFVNTAIYNKITDINNSIVYGEMDGEVAGRGELYNKSWNNFLDNPVLGNAKKADTGGHSFFIDRLSYFGIVGTLPFFLFLYYTFKNHYSLISKERKFYYLIGVFTFIILGFSKNVSGIEPFLYVIVFLPGLAFSIPLNEKMNFK